LGASFVVELARRGYDVWIHYRTPGPHLEALTARVRALGREAWGVQADLSVPGGVEDLVAQVTLGPPSLIVHSASAWIVDTAASASAQTWETSHRIHGWAAVVLARSLGQWSTVDRPGHLVTLLDSRLRDKDPHHFSYAFGKRELAMVTRYLAADLAPGVRVNGLAPGLILKGPAMTAAAWKAAGREATPLGRPGRTVDLIRALRFLLDNPYVTGQILTVDGGRHLQGDLFGSL